MIENVGKERSARGGVYSSDSIANPHRNNTGKKRASWVLLAHAVSEPVSSSHSRQQTEEEAHADIRKTLRIRTVYRNKAGSTKSESKPDNKGAHNLLGKMRGTRNRPVRCAAVTFFLLRLENGILDFRPRVGGRSLLPRGP